MVKKMSKVWWKNFRLCFSKVKCLPTIEEDEDFAPIDYSKNLSLVKGFAYVHHDPTFEYTPKSSMVTSSTEDFLTCDDDYFSDSIPDFSICSACQRLFFSAPGRSNSIIESPDSPLPEHSRIRSGGVAIQTYSPDPYADFRGSMEEMAEAREIRDVKADWEALHELLLCYLTLNPKHTHKLILSAFADLVISLMSSSTTANQRYL